MKKVVISASSLPAGRNMSSQLDYLARVQNYGADMYHLDVMDGEYTKYKSIDHSYIEQLREKSVMLFDTHLMVMHPDKVVSKYIKAGADIISFQIEVLDHDAILALIKKIKKLGKRVGLAVDLDTDIKKIDPYLNLIDMVLILCVKAGKGGQEFDKNALKKIKYVRNINKDILIEVDGGINPNTGSQCVRAGADILVSGNYIYSNDTYDAIHELKGKNG